MSSEFTRIIQVFTYISQVSRQSLLAVRDVKDVLVMKIALRKEMIVLTLANILQPKLVS